ncbi:unnamed protein product [Dicrocoelium dendriticum]|nr:unnamed protein product [Dicrocoelium dendriticum]
MLFFATALLLIMEVYTLTCYHCTDCKPDKSKVAGMCGACLTDFDYVNNKLVKVSRVCAGGCIAYDTRPGGTGQLRTCCHEDFCNCRSEPGT